MVVASEIEKSVIEQKERMLTKSLGEEREKLGSIKQNPKHILIITGIRRCGKSTIMHQLASKQTEQYAYFNFEDTRIEGFESSDFAKLDTILGQETQYYYFDEIQNVANWEIFIRNLHDREKTICITGPNASLLSKELGTRLTGRHLRIELFPFSYSEYLTFRKNESNNEAFVAYLNEGGFPDYLTTGNLEVLQQLFKDIIYRDIIVRYGIRNAKLFIDLALYLISNSAKEYSLNKLKKTFNIGSANSVADYIHWLEDSYILYSVPKFSWSLQKVAINAKKVYVIDTGFAKSNSLSFSEDHGRLFENAVFLHLRRKHSEIYYFKEKKECNFVVKELDKVTQAIQVCYELNSDNLQREIDGLVEALIFFKLTEGIIVSLWQEDYFEKDGKKIKVIPAFKWFLT